MEQLGIFGESPQQAKVKRYKPGSSDVIYEPKGKAGEYSPLALNIYKGCTHGCRYCYCPEFCRMQRDVFHAGANPKKDIIKKIRRDAAKARGDDRAILLSFMGDPYQREEVNLKLTRQAIEILIENELSFTVLTKGGRRAARDFDLLSSHGRKAGFGSTIVFTSQEDADHWEPGAASLADRVEAIRDASLSGIPTWVSLEPVIDPRQALDVIRDLHSAVDHWKVGKVNHMPSIEHKVNWIRFREEVKELLNSLGADYYLKNSLTDLRG